MTERNSKSENTQRRFSQEQYEMLKRCSDNKNMTEWNEWRKENPTRDVELDVAQISGCWLQGVHFGTEALLPHLWLQEPGKKSSFSTLCSVQLQCAHCEGANFELARLKVASAHRAHLEGACLRYAYLNNACFAETYLEGTCLDGSHLQGANFERAIVDGSTSLWRCEVDRETNFEGVSLDSIRIDPATKQLLEYNIRRKNWEEWYKEHPKLKYIVKPFWLMSDYGLSTWRIVAVFLVSALVFAAVYYLWGCIGTGIVDNLFVGRNGVVVPWWLVPLRAFYFSIITMTLGFSDMYANAQSIWGHILITVQALLGYVLLGALVTRFAVLFTAGGPAGRFAKETKATEDTEKNGLPPARE